MTTEAQLEAFDDSSNFMPSIEQRARQAFRRVGTHGATVDEAFRLAYPRKTYTHSDVDSFRVAVRHLREDGEIKDSGRKRDSTDSGRAQTVWELGDDRDRVERDRRRKLRKFETDWLIDELRSRGIVVTIVGQTDSSSST